MWKVARLFGHVGLMLTLILFSIVSAAEAQAKPQKWSFMILRSNLSSFDDIQLNNAFERIKKRTNGALDIQIVFSGSLPIKSDEWLRAVGNGDLEGCVVVGHYHSGDMPILGILDTPFVFRSQLEKAQAAAAGWPILQSEANKRGVELIAYIPSVEAGFWTTEPIANILDLGGRKIRAQAKLYVNMIKVMNGVPVPVEWGETYPALQRGLVKGIFTGYDSFTSAKLMEVAPYAHRINLHAAFYFAGVNKALWDKLSPDMRLIVLDEIARAMVVVQANMPNVIENEIRKQKEGGLKSYEPEPPAQWGEVMAEKVTKPLLAEEMAKCGDVGQQLVTVIEKALGRKLH